MSTANKCIVYGCLNTKCGGRFIGDLCSPCHSAITEAPVLVPACSQVWRNARRMAELYQEKQTALQRAVKEIERLQDMACLPEWANVKEFLLCH